MTAKELARPVTPALARLTQPSRSSVSSAGHVVSTTRSSLWISSPVVTDESLGRAPATSLPSTAPPNPTTRRRTQAATSGPAPPFEQTQPEEPVPDTVVVVVTHISELATPALLVDLAVFEANAATMTAARPGLTLRPHIKAFKSTAVARRLASAGHLAFCCATVREMEGMAAAGLGEDLLLANEVLDATRLGALVDHGARVTVAVDSPQTIAAAASGGVGEVLIDVNVGLPRCGCHPDDAGALAEAARSAGLVVRGVMGYEGHLMTNPNRAERAQQVAASMAHLTAAHAMVGGDVVSGGGTGTFDVNDAVTEIQAGSYLFMDTHYAGVGLPFDEALSVLATVISVDSTGRWAVADAGLKALAMDHGNPAIAEGDVAFCSDEHTTLTGGSWRVGDRVRLRPAHVDPTIAKHTELVVVAGDDVVDRWPIDLRHW